MTTPTESARRHILTVALEDYFHVGAFNRLIQRGQWYRFETRLERGALRTLDLLDEYGIRATFFALGWIGDTFPEIIRLVADRGHEIASKGYYHRGIRGMSPLEFREDLARAREALERAGGQRVIGYRVADDWFRPEDLWALDILAEEGYEYDSSIGPLFRTWQAEPWRRFSHPHHYGERVLWEFPISSADILGWMVPIGGGNYFRQLPHWLVSRAVANWASVYSAPLVLYFHTWELDPDQPRINAAAWTTRLRQYRHLSRMPEILRHYLSRYQLSGIAEYLGVALPGTEVPARRPPPAAPVAPPALPAPVTGSPGRTPVTIVIPCYNEELILPYLSNTLASLVKQLSADYEISFIFVDDCSADNTLDDLDRLFGSRPDCQILHHMENRGVAAAIQTGVRHAETEIVCSIDCDCTYDPHELAHMIPLLEPGVDLVTASPYHPEGRVRNVPGWRLVLSRGLSRLYRVLVGGGLHTWTSCFRVYRREAALSVEVREGGFLGVAELVSKLIIQGRRVVEFPAVLEVRMLGRSKMKILKTMAGHLGLLFRLAVLRRRGLPALPVSTPTGRGRHSGERARL
ncbi:MAG: glycosyltransferase [Gemmatimonadales bacterium]